MSKSDNGVTKQLQKLFKITVKNNKQTSTKDLYPGTILDNGNLVPINFTTDIQKIFQEWKSDLTSTDDLKNRMQRYSDLDFMVENCGYIGLAVKLYANETITPDESGKIIKVYSRNKDVESYINNFFSNIGINRSLLENTAYDIAKYADHFWIRNIDSEKGIVEVIPVDVKQVKDRIEFSAIDELEKNLNKQMWTGFTNASIDIQDVVNAIENKVVKNDYGEMYRRYTFGFSFGEDQKTILPPWAVSHFRRFSTQSEFSPFGRPLLISSLSIYREYKSALNLLAMARVAKFPKEVFKIAIDEEMTPTERLIAVNEARQEFMNLVNLDNSREPMSIGSAIWTIKDLFEYELIQNSMDLGEIADVELLKDELISSTLVPKGYMITGESSWGDQGKALLQQSKVFAREVYTNQTAILNELTDLVKTQFVITNKFDGEDTEFELSLAYPNSEQATENISNQKDMMDLANAVIENLKTALAVDSIPIDVAKDIFKKYASIDNRDLDKWMKDIETTVDLKIKQPEYEEPNYESIKKEKLRKGLSKLNESVFREAYFEAKKEKMFTEGVMNGQHFVTNFGNNNNQKFAYNLMKEVVKSSKNNKKIED